MPGRIHKTGHRVFLTVEGVFNRVFGNASNPFYHLGTLSFFFFWIVLISGIYVFIPWSTQVDQAYASVEYMTHDQWYLAGIMRSLHRYASDAAVITVVLHLAREFFRDRYRGLRWFSWFTGVPTLWLVILLGISGYWLVWDQLAQYIAITTAELIDWIPAVPGSMALNFAEGAITDRFFILMAFLHLLAFPVMLVFALWIHVSRISSVQIMSPPILSIGAFVALLLLSLIKPAVSHGPANPFQAPTVLNLDWFYLNAYPLIDIWGPGPVWFLSTGITLFLMILPWLPRKDVVPVAEVTLEHCNGCTNCWQDCPFGAITMMPRSDGRAFDAEPIVDPSLCVSCGICAGSCNSSTPFRMRDTILKTGIDMPQRSVQHLREEVLKQLEEAGRQPGRESDWKPVVVFGCEHGVEIEFLARERGAVTVSLLCSGMLPPSFLDYVLKKGADGVLVTGCREGDCYYRLGNRWTVERIDRMREPSLVKRTDRDRIARFWAASGDSKALLQRFDDFQKGLNR